MDGPWADVDAAPPTSSRSFRGSLRAYLGGAPMKGGGYDHLRNGMRFAPFHGLLAR